MILVALVASVAVKLVPMSEPYVVTDAKSLARWEFYAAPTTTDWCLSAPYPPGKGQPGYGWPSRVEDYEVDASLARRLAEYPGLEAHWFIREPLDCDAAKSGRRDRSYSDSSPFLLFRPKANRSRWWNPLSWFGSRKVPLVVYLPGCGEQGTDLVKQFRQVGVISRVLSRKFQEEHPAWLLVPMPPQNANCGIPSGYPAVPRAPLITLYDDLVLKVVEMSRAEDSAFPRIDERRIYLTGLGSGGTMVGAMSLDHPGRYAVTAAAWSRPYRQPVLHPDAPGNWWFGFEYNTNVVLSAGEESFNRKFWGKFRGDVERFGGAFELRNYSKGCRAWWWDTMWESDEFWKWCFRKKSNGEVEVKQ